MPVLGEKEGGHLLCIAMQFVGSVGCISSCGIEAYLFGKKGARCRMANKKVMCFVDLFFFLRGDSFKKLK